MDFAGNRYGRLRPGRGGADAGWMVFETGEAQEPIDGTLHGATEEWGPLVRQPAPAARLARILHRSAQDLWDSCSLTDPAQMWDEARAIASSILASCPIE